MNVGATRRYPLPHWRGGDHLAVDRTRGVVRTARAHVRRPFDRRRRPDRSGGRRQVAAGRGAPRRRRRSADGARRGAPGDAVHPARRDGPSPAIRHHAQHRARRRRPRLPLPPRPAASRRARGIGATARGRRRRRSTRRDFVGCPHAVHGGTEHLPRRHHPGRTTAPVGDRLLAEGRARGPDAAAAADPRRRRDAAPSGARRTGRHRHCRTTGRGIARQPPDPARTRAPLARPRRAARTGRAVVPQRVADILDPRGADRVATRGPRHRVDDRPRDAGDRRQDRTRRHRGDDRPQGPAPPRAARPRPSRPRPTSHVHRAQSSDVRRSHPGAPHRAPGTGAVPAARRPPGIPRCHGVAATRCNSPAGGSKQAERSRSRN